MPYKKYYRNGKWHAKNMRTGKVTKYSSRKKMENHLRMKEAIAHGWKPTGLARASKATRKRVARLGGKASRKKRRK